MKRTLQKNHGSLYSMIPKPLIEYFGLEVGDQIDFRLEKNYIKVMPVHTNRQAENVPAAPPEFLKLRGAND